jgi:hypothetical protein
MSNRSASSLRGIRYALLIAFTLMALFFAGEYVSHIKRKAYYHAPRTTTLSVRTRPGNASRIVAEPIPLEIEPTTEFLDRSTWSNYKSEAPTSIVMIEPPAGARLTAPVSMGLSDPFPEYVAKPRLAIGADESRGSIAASAVSTSSPIVARISSVEAAPNPAAISLWSRNWPRPLQLENEVVALRERGSTADCASLRDWLARIEWTLTELQKTELIDSKSQELIDNLDELAQRGYAASQELQSDLETASDVSRIAYSLERRFAVWNAVHQCVARDGRVYVAPRNYSIDSSHMAAQLAAVRKAIASTSDNAGWSNYLMLDRIEDLASGRIGTKESQMEVAREFLGRVTNARVSEEQLRVLQSAPVHRLADQIHPLTIKPVDYRKLIVDIEALESNPVHRCSGGLADAIQSLRFSEHPELGAIAAAITTHYRNANVRLSVSETFLNRMMPRGQVTAKPVQQKILGADTRGASRVASSLKVDLIPDPSAWHLKLILDGDVDSNTQSSRNGATFYNSSSAHVQSNREIRVDARSLKINGSPATVESSDSLRRFSTNWDSMPIVGDMIRSIAHQEFMQSRPVAKRITQRLIAKQTDEEFDRQLQSKIESAQDFSEERLLGPLQSMNLSPLVFDMQTTENRLIARYRLAGPNQISAYTPRPLAPGDSQLSLQVHHSVFNNLIDQAIDTRRNWTVQSLSDSIADILQQPHPTLPSDTPNDVTIRFADPNPMSIEFEEGRMWLTLRIESLEQPGRIHLKNFTIRTSYTANITGLQAELVRDGVILIDGHRLGSRDRLPLRAIFTKVFSGRTSLPMVSNSLLEDPRANGLIVSQFELRDGWLAIAVSDRSEPMIASPKGTSAAVR